MKPSRHFHRDSLAHAADYKVLTLFGVSSKNVNIRCMSKILLRESLRSRATRYILLSDTRVHAAGCRIWVGLKSFRCIGATT